MNAKNISNFILIFSLALLVAGCFEYEERIKLNKDGSGSMEVEYWTMKEVNIDDDAFNFPKEKEDIRKEVEQKYTSDNVKLTDFKVDEKKSSRHVQFKVTFDYITDLNDVEQFSKNYIKFKKTGKHFEFNRQVFIDDGKVDKKEEAENLFERLVISLVEEGLSKIKFRFEIELPYKIVESNADWTPADNRAVWKYRLSDVMHEDEVEMKLETE